MSEEANNLVELEEEPNVLAIGRFRECIEVLIALDDGVQEHNGKRYSAKLVYGEEIGDLVDKLQDALMMEIGDRYCEMLWLEESKKSNRPARRGAP